MREGNPLFLKLFDIALLAGPRLYYCDSDVLFVRRFTGIFAPPVEKAQFTFMADSQHAYALRPWQLPPSGPVQIVGRVNTGLIVWQRPELDLDLLEWLFGRLHADRGFCSRPYWAEQTSWAVLAARAETYLFDERRIVLARADMSRLSPDAIAIHFVSTHRDQLIPYRDRPLPDEPPASIPAYPARRVAALGMVGSELRRRIGALVSRVPGFTGYA